MTRSEWSLKIVSPSKIQTHMQQQQFPSFSAPVQSSRPMIPAGAHYGRIISIIHLGNVVDYQGNRRDKIKLTFETEVMHEFQDGVKPLVLSVEMSRSFGELSGLRKVWLAAFPSTPLEAFNQEPNIFQLLGQVVQITVIHKPNKKGTMNESIQSYSSLMPGSQAPQQFNPPTMFAWIPDVNAMAYFRESLGRLDNWTKSVILESSEFSHFLHNGILPQDMAEMIRNGAQEYHNKKSGNQAQPPAQVAQPQQQWAPPVQQPTYQQPVAQPQQQWAPPAQQQQPAYQQQPQQPQQWGAQQQPQQPMAPPAQQMAPPVGHPPQQQWAPPAQNQAQAPQPVYQPQPQQMAPPAQAPTFDATPIDDLPF